LKPPTPRQQKFVDKILEGESQTKAAVAAGYGATAGTMLSRSGTVKEALAKAREEIEDISTLKRIDVLNLFLEAIDMARLLADPGNMINGADKIAKMLGYYAPETHKIELGGTAAALAHRLQTMSDHELLEIAAGNARVIDAEEIAP
jgi:hypothetical protein